MDSTRAFEAVPVRSLAVLACGVAAAVALPALLVGAAAAAAWPWTVTLALGAGAGAAAGAIVAARTVSARVERTARLLGAVADTMGQPRLLIDRDRRAIWRNAAFRKFFGDNDEQPLDGVRRALCAESDAARLFDEVSEAARAGVAKVVEIPGPGAPEAGRVWEVSVQPIPGEAGGSSWRFRDLTSLRGVEAASRDKESRLLDFLENAPVGFFSVDGLGRFLYANQTLLDWLGLSGADIAVRGLTLRDVLDSRPADGTAPYDPFGAGADEHAAEVTLRGKDGRPFPAYVSQSVVRHADGTLRTRSVVRNLGPERAMALALARSEQSFQRFFEEAPVGIALVDAKGLIGESNRAFRRTVGLGALDGKGRNLLDLVVPEDRQTLAERLSRVSEAPGRSEAGAIEIRLAPKPGSGARQVTASVFASRLERGESGPAGVILHLLDITDRKHLETQFAQSQKMQAVGQLAGGIAHDFNNLLTAMIGFCDLLLLRHRAGDQSFADIMQIKHNANRAASLVRQLLAFSRQQTLQPKVLDVTDALSDLGHLLRRLIGENIQLKFVHGRNLHPVRVDQGQLEQVIINLAVNARDAMAGGGSLTIRTDNLALARPEVHGSEEVPAGEYVCIQVIDTGHGIPKDVIGRIFEPFFSTKEVGSGTGLGLSTVHGIVHQTGGFIFVESEPGQGATFTIYLPRWKGGMPGDAVRGTAGEPKRRDLTGAGTVLLVEDEDAVRLFSARALKNKGYKVVEAASGEAALELLADEARDIDLLITDVVMPNMDGTTLIRTVREQRPGMKVICISGYAEEQFRKRLDSAENVHFLPKPFTLDELAGKVKEALRGP